MKRRDGWFGTDGSGMWGGAGPGVALATGLGGGFVLCGLLALSSGIPFLDIPAAIWRGAWGDGEATSATLAKMSPLLLTGLAVTLAFRAGLLNIGCEGQLTLGGLCAAVLALGLDAAPWPVTVGVAVAGGALAGGLWAFPALWLRENRGVHEVVSTLLLNYVALYLAEYLVLGPFGDGSAMGRTREIGWAGTLGALLSVGNVTVTVAPILAVLLCWAAHVWLDQSVWGYEARATGDNGGAAEVAGIRARAWRTRMFILSGALAGLAGALEVLAVHHRFYRSFSPGYGFDGITAAFLVGASPGWLPVGAVVLASLRAADKWLQLELGVSPNVITMLQAAILMSVAGGGGAWGLLSGWIAGRRFRKGDGQVPNARAPGPLGGAGGDP